jgi:predicted AlkP superfamily pyrophosphatase or phosphodiesterase
MTTRLLQGKIVWFNIGMSKILLITIAALLIPVQAAVSAANSRHVVLIVWDGMRPDFVTEKYAPTLDRLAHDGVRFRNHHSVYPTATDVNGAALATGCYPNRNGLAANLEFRPAINSRQPIDMGDPDSIKRGDDVSGGKYLAIPTFVELLRAAGKKVALVGAKSVAMLFDRQNDWTYARIKGKALTIFAAAPLDPAAREEMTKLVGPLIDDPGATAAQRNHFATRALTEFFWRDSVPDFSLLWLSEPDLAEHNFAPGSPEAIAAIKAVDNELAMVLSALDKKRVRDSTDIFVVSDHGFSTIRRSVDVVALLNKAGFRAAKEFSDKPNPGDILVAGNGGTVLFYVRDHDRDVTQRLVDWLQRSDFAGVIFTRDRLARTFASSDAFIETTDGADVVMSFRSYDEKNQFSVTGMIDADWNRKAGEGTHATLSRFDVNNALLAAGPEFRRGLEISAPSGNIDLAPTILAISGVDIPKGLAGRRLDNGEDGSSDWHPQSGARHLEANNGGWHQQLHITHFSGSDYLESQESLAEKVKQ